MTFNEQIIVQTKKNGPTPVEKKRMGSSRIARHDPTQWIRPTVVYFQRTNAIWLRDDMTY